MPQFHWYEVVTPDDGLAQGDFVTDCPVIVPIGGLEGDQLTAKVVEYDVVVMSQSCDLAFDKLDLVLVCPVWPYSGLAQNNSYLRSSDGRKALKRGEVVGYHLLNPCDLPGFEVEHRVVDFRNVYGIDLDTLKRILGEREKRVRLLPPYREHLSQAFARFFMRVGLPVDTVDIPRTE